MSFNLGRGPSHLQNLTTPFLAPEVRLLHFVRSQVSTGDTRGLQLLTETGTRLNRHTRTQDVTIIKDTRDFTFEVPFRKESAIPKFLSRILFITPVRTIIFLVYTSFHFSLIPPSRHLTPYFQISEHYTSSLVKVRSSISLFIFGFYKE